MVKKSEVVTQEYTVKPALVDREFREQLVSIHSVLQANSEFAEVLAKPVMHGDDFWGDPSDKYDWRNIYRPYDVNEQGVLVINVLGVLLEGFPYQFSDWCTGYEYIQRAFERGMQDGNVKSIMLYVKSGGGSALGCFELGDSLRDLKAEYGKPVHGHAVIAFSAAYSIISVADSISVTRTGMTGSIGVLTVHYDMSKAHERMGVTVTEITSGKLKADGSANKPLGEASRARIQERSDELYEEFIEQVHLNRGMDRDAIRATEADLFSSKKSVEIGLADEVASFESKLAEYSNQGSSEMSTTKTNGNEAATFTQADLDAAKLSGVQEGREAGLKEGSTEAQARFNAVVESDLYKGREETAKTLLANEKFSADDILSTLKTVPAKTEAAATGKGKGSMEFKKMDQAMGDSPEIGPNGGDEEDDDGEDGSELSGEKAVSGILANYDAATGGRKKPKAPK